MTNPQLQLQTKLKTNIEDLEIHEIPFSPDVLSNFTATNYELVSSRKGSVDLSKVVGCTHPRYAGLSWGILKPSKMDVYGDLADPDFENQTLKRARLRMRDLKETPEYFLSFIEKEYWSFAEIDGLFYVTEGVHRSVIARYFFHLNGLPPIVHGVAIAKMKRKSEEALSAAPIQKKPLFSINEIAVVFIILVSAFALSF